ncbi:MAG TPA: EamA family transporter [Pseudonocardiaceae bacterium]|nr:EamA family transporter [Pseudonocardiaceae bacterium]
MRVSPALVFSGLLWGSGGLLGSLLGRTAGLSPLAVASYRLIVGGALIVAVLVLARRRFPRGRAAWRRILIVGLLTASYQGCYFAAVSMTSVSLATLITIGAAPLLVLAVERARFDRRKVSTVVLGLAGLGLLVGSPAGGVTVAGAGLALVSAAGFAALSLLGRRPVPGLDDLTMTGLGFAIGGSLLAALAAPAVGLGFAVHANTIGLLVALGAAPTAIAYALYFRGLRVSAASTGALMALLEPLTGTILAVLLLGDRLSVAGIVGAVLLCGGVALAATTPRVSPNDYNTRSDVHSKTHEGA